MAPPPSFQLGANAVVEASRRALPAYQGTFIGREAVCGELLSTLRSGAPAVVVWGGPGIGKTRLVVEALRQIASQGNPPWDALVYGDLRDARTADDVVRLLAREAGISLESSASPEIALGRALGKLGRVLLVLDPIEHLPDLLAATVHAFARMSRTTQVLAISRRRWSAAEAISIELGPLPTRSDGGTLSPAGLLLLERGGWSLTSLAPADVERTEQVASALEGIPLAIELSATHAQLLGIEGLLARVVGPQGPAALALSVTREDEPMHRALERSWELLRPAEREAFVQCAVFRGGFTVQAAEAVVRVGSPAPSALAL
jgi:predicted ATPase